MNKAGFYFLQEVHFKDCKMLGLRFDNCNSFGLSFSFDGCQLNHTSFYKTKIKSARFNNSQLQGVDFKEADLTNTVFDNYQYLLNNKTIPSDCLFMTAISTTQL